MAALGIDSGGGIFEVAFNIAVMTVSLANEHAHWRVRQRRAKLQREQTQLAWLAAVGRRPLRDGETARVVLTRLSRGRLDTDNLPVATKSCRDQIADCLGVDDRSPRVLWAYRQASGRGVDVHITIWPAQLQALDDHAKSSAPRAARGR